MNGCCETISLPRRAGFDVAPDERCSPRPNRRRGPVSLDPPFKCTCVVNTRQATTRAHCKALANSRGISALRAPSAALVPGGAHGWKMEDGWRIAPGHRARRVRNCSVRPPINPHRLDGHERGPAAIRSSRPGSAIVTDRWLVRTP
jgi:hypothetical protein